MVKAKFGLTIWEIFLFKEHNHNVAQHSAGIKWLYTFSARKIIALAENEGGERIVGSSK